MNSVTRTSYQAALTALNGAAALVANRPSAAASKRRWRNWKPHTAPKLTAKLQNDLIRHWQALIEANGLSGWNDLKRSHIEAWIQKRLETGLTADGFIRIIP
ncbi:MAG: hypothetical protein IPH82_02745 [Chloroflexi bacterium]|nr:hypothetical protein [Chloroflexota bacterium]